MSGTSGNPLWVGPDPNLLTAFNAPGVSRTDNPLLSGPTIGAAQPPTPADAYAFNQGAVGDYIAQQRAQSEAMGLWGPGGITPAGARAAGGQVATGLALASTAPKGDVPGFIAYHGSPHDFDAFDSSKIGTGEGAQAYGHGLYVADAQNVAQQYRDQLRWKGAAWDDPQVLAQNAIDRVGGDRAAAAASLQSALDSTTNFYRGKVPAAQAEANQNTAQAVALLRGAEPITGKPPTPGRMYEVHVAADPAHFLDWDRPLSEQHPVVQQALAPMLYRDAQAVPAGNGMSDVKIGKATLGTVPTARIDTEGLPSVAASIDPRTGGALYESNKIVPGDYRDPQAASAALQQAGIPGIRYLDAGSRGAGEGSKNSVVFDPKIMTVLRKYAVPAAMLSGTGHGLVTQGSSDQSDQPQ
jgi:hypothetical protein